MSDFFQPRQWCDELYMLFLLSQVLLYFHPILTMCFPCKYYAGFFYPMIRLYYGQPNDVDRGWTIESLWKPHTKNGRLGGWPPALWAKVIIFYVYTYNYGTNRTSECYSIPAFYYAENISLISKHFISKCQVSVAIFVGIKMAVGVFTTGHFELKYFEINDFFLYNRTPGYSNIHLFYWYQICRYKRNKWWL